MDGSITAGSVCREHDYPAARLAVVAVHDGIHDGLAEGALGDRPKLAPLQADDLRPGGEALQQELPGILKREEKGRPSLEPLVRHRALGASGEQVELLLAQLERAEEERPGVVEDGIVRVGAGGLKPELRDKRGVALRHPAVPGLVVAPGKVKGGGHGVGQTESRRLGGPVVAATLLQEPARLVASQFLAAGAETRSQSTVAADLLEGRGDVDEVDSVAFDRQLLDDVDGKVRQREGVDPLAQPGRVEIGADEGGRTRGLIVDADDEDASVAAVGEAGGFFRQSPGCGLVLRGGGAALAVKDAARLLLEVEGVRLQIGWAPAQSDLFDGGTGPPDGGNVRPRTLQSADTPNEPLRGTEYKPT